MDGCSRLRGMCFALPCCSCSVTCVILAFPGAQFAARSFSSRRQSFVLSQRGSEAYVSSLRRKDQRAWHCSSMRLDQSARLAPASAACAVNHKNFITDSQEAFPETGAPLNAKGEVRTRCLFCAIALTPLLCSHG